MSGKVYTKTGDDGTTGLVGGSRRKKYDLRLEAYGAVDELNAILGVIRSMEVDGVVGNLIAQIQNKLFSIGSRLASDEKGEAFTSKLAIKTEDVEMLEYAIDNFEKELPQLKNFILPGGNCVAAQFHLARTVCRRTERRIVELSDHEHVFPELKKYMNRLSDLLFVLARISNFRKGVDETLWMY